MNKNLKITTFQKKYFCSFREGKFSLIGPDTIALKVYCKSLKNSVYQKTLRKEIRKSHSWRKYLQHINLKEDLDSGGTISFYNSIIK